MRALSFTFVLTTALAGLVHGSTLISLNDPVTLSGSFAPFDAVCGGGAPQPAAGSVDNGVFQPEETCYQSGIHWQGTSNTISIDFGGTFMIDGAIVQADDNDTYELDYLGTDNLYHLWWSIPEDPSFGLVTRPNADQTTIQSLPAVQALGVQIFATGGDGLYAVSQVEVFSDAAVPEPSSFVLLSAGAVGLLALSLRKRFTRA